MGSQNQCLTEGYCAFIKLVTVFRFWEPWFQTPEQFFGNKLDEDKYKLPYTPPSEVFVDNFNESINEVILPNKLNIILNSTRLKELILPHDSNLKKVANISQLDKSGDFLLEGNFGARNSRKYSIEKILEKYPDARIHALTCPSLDDKNLRDHLSNFRFQLDGEYIQFSKVTKVSLSHENFLSIIAVNPYFLPHELNYAKQINLPRWSKSIVMN